MTTLKKIKSPIARELQEFEPYFKKSLASDIPLLATILNFLYRKKGKQLRPIFGRLCRGAASYSNTCTRRCSRRIL